MFVCRIVHQRLRCYLLRTYAMASKMYVRCVEEEDKIQLSFEYSHKRGELRTFNALRPQNEELGRCLERIAANVSKKVEKKKKKSEPGTDQESSLVVKALYQNEQEIPNGTSTKEALSQGNIVTINGVRLVIEVNAPACLGLSIPESIMAGFPIFPKIDIEFADLEDCDFCWEKLKYEREINEEAERGSKKQKSDNVKNKIVKSIKICNSLHYTPTNEDIEFHLKLTCLPKSGDRTGKPYSAESKFAVGAGPGLCPFENRQLYTKTVTQNGKYVI